LSFYIDSYEDNDEPDILYCPSCDHDLIMEFDVTEFSDKSILEKKRIAEYSSVVNEDINQFQNRLEETNKKIGELTYCIKNLYICLDNLDKNIHLVEGL
jgi:hypothetical protein